MSARALAIVLLVLAWPDLVSKVTQTKEISVYLCGECGQPHTKKTTPSIEELSQTQTLLSAQDYPNRNHETTWRSGKDCINPSESRFVGLAEAGRH